MTEIIETILSVSALASAFILTSAIYVFFVSRFLPKMLLSPKYSHKMPSDRGLKKYLFPKGRAVVYKPSCGVSEYVDQYILQSKSGEKSIVCKVNDKVEKIKYDVSAFDVGGKLIDIIQVEEKLKFTNITAETELPLDTAYVGIVVKEINGEILKDAPKLSFSAIKLGIFFVICIILSVIESLFARGLIAKVIYLIDDSADIVGGGASLLLGIAVGAVLSGLVFLLHLSKETKIEK